MTISATRRLTASTAAAVLAVVTLVSCSSSGSDHKTGAPPSSPPVSAGMSPDAATVAQIKNAYSKFFAPSTPVAVSLSLLQNGAAFKQTVIDQSKGDLAKKSSAKVSSVTLQSANVAKVKFTILVSGQAMLKDQPGLAIREDGKWKVAGATFCALLTLQGGAPPACKAPESTSLPK